MSREEFLILVKALKATYTDPKFIPDGYSIEIWFRLLSDLDYTTCELAIQNYMQLEKFPPTPAGIREKVAEIKLPSSDDLTAEEAWALVRNSISVPWDMMGDSFDALPAICQKAVVSPKNMTLMAQMDINELGTVEKSHFLRNFRAIQQRAHEDAKISPKLMELINKVKESQEALETSKGRLSEAKDDGNI